MDQEIYVAPFGIHWTWKYLENMYLYYRVEMLASLYTGAIVAIYGSIETIPKEQKENETIFYSSHGWLAFVDKIVFEYVLFSIVVFILTSFR